MSCRLPFSDPEHGFFCPLDNPNEDLESCRDCAWWDDFDYEELDESWFPVL